MNAIRHFTTCLLLASAAVCTPALAQDTEATRQVAMERYLRAVPMAKMMEDTYSEMAKLVPPENRAEFVSMMRKHVKIDRIEAIAKQSMLKTFTTNELNALADFYLSEHGASGMKKFGAYMSDVMPALMQEVQRATQEIQAEKR